MPTDKDDPLANQKIRDRYYGQNDPLAAKYNARLSAVSTLVAPEDESITTLWVGGMEPSITQEDLRCVARCSFWWLFASDRRSNYFFHITGIFLHFWEGTLFTTLEKLQLFVLSRGSGVLSLSSLHEVRLKLRRRSYSIT